MATRLQATTREFKAAKLRKKANKAAKKVLISNLYEQLENIKDKNHGELPYGELNRQLTATNEPLCDDLKITHHDLQNYARLQTKPKTVASPPTLQSEEEPNPSAEKPINKGGRPKGSTGKNIRHAADCAVAARNEITKLFSDAKRKAKRVKGRMKRVLYSR